MLIQAVRHTLDEIDHFLSQVSADQYNYPCPQLSGSTIGQHTRHIIELFECLINQYNEGTINYDNRCRNPLTETLPDYARECVEKVRKSINKPDKQLMLAQRIACEHITLQSNYHRELLYNLEHCIHHQALIKVATVGMRDLQVHENFGVAPSTIEFKKQCAQ